jgi:hypothetical protein
MNKLIASLTVLTLSAAASLFAQDNKADSSTKEIKGEILDMACYTDHGASGEKHAGCAEKCISSGLPVGIKGEDGTVYLVIGEHKPLNKDLAPYAGKTVTLKGKAVSRDGVNLLENAEIVK